MNHLFIYLHIFSRKQTSIKKSNQIRTFWTEEKNQFKPFLCNTTYIYLVENKPALKK